MRRVVDGQFGKARSAGFGVLIAAGSLSAIFGGCGADSGRTTSGFNEGAGGATGSAGTNTSGTGNSGTGGEDFNPSGTGTGMGTASTGTGESCAATSAEANLVPVNMFVMFDKSGSMKDNNKWTNATKALTDFFKDTGSAGLRVALRFFPDDGCEGGNDAQCMMNTCEVPLVSLASLTIDAAPVDTQEQKLIDAVSSKTPSGGTPMSIALGGAEKWAADYQSAHLGEKTVVVLVTDGDPNGCDENVSNIAALAATTLASNGVLTYAVGLVGATPMTMTSIATAGGTQAIFIGNGNASADLITALKAIQGSQVSCTFQMPTMGAMGETIDPKLVNVNYTPGDGSPAVTFGQVDNQAACTAQKGGWFYDNPSKPTTITLCPSTCTSVQADEKAKIDILLGCATKPAQ